MSELKPAREGMEESVRMQVLRKIGEGVEYDSSRGGRLILVGRRMKPRHEVAHPMLSNIEAHHPHFSKWRAV